jgi:hypothetical protein
MNSKLVAQYGLLKGKPGFPRQDYVRYPFMELSLLLFVLGYLYSRI